MAKVGSRSRARSRADSLTDGEQRHYRRAASRSQQAARITGGRSRRTGVAFAASDAMRSGVLIGVLLAPIDQHFTKTLRARWVSTLRDAIDIPLATAASFNDISLSLSSRIACCCPGGRFGDGSLESMAVRALCKVRSRLRKGFMLGSQRRLAGPDAALPAQPVDESPVGDRDQPGPERPGGIVGLPDRMDSQQNVLNRVFRILGSRCRRAASERR